MKKLRLVVVFRARCHKDDVCEHPRDFLARSSGEERRDVDAGLLDLPLDEHPTGLDVMRDHVDVRFEVEAADQNVDEALPILTPKATAVRLRPFSLRVESSSATSSHEAYRL